MHCGLVLLPSYLHQQSTIFRNIYYLPFVGTLGKVSLIPVREDSIPQILTFVWVDNSQQSRKDIEMNKEQNRTSGWEFEIMTTGVITSLNRKIVIPRSSFWSAGPNVV
jgi:hypothetical protein